MLFRSAPAPSRVIAILGASLLLSLAAGGALRAQDAAEAAGQDWPMSRGNLLNRGDLGPRPDIRHGRVRWEFIASSRVTTEPVVADGVVYFHDHASIVHAVEVRTGKKVWTGERRKATARRKELDRERLGDLVGLNADERIKDGCVFSGPVVAGDAVVSATQSGVLTCYARKDGKVRWEIELPGEVFSTPRFFDGKVIIPCVDKKIHALDISNGQEVWSFEGGDIWGCTPAITSSGTIMAACYDKNLYLLDAKDGRLKRRLTIGYRTNAHLCFAEATLFFPSSGRRFNAMSVIDGKMRWTAENPSQVHQQSVAYRDGQVFLQLGKELLCFRTNDGKKLWSHEFSEPGANTVCLGEKLVYIREGIYVYAFAIEDGAQRFRVTIGTKNHTSPVLSDGVLIVCDGNGVVRGIE